MTALTKTGVTLVCPRCKGPLAHRAEAFTCHACSAEYPVVAGIPDLRVEPDPWISIEDDRDKARRVEALTHLVDFATAVETYWDITPETPDERKRHFTRAVLDGERLAGEWLDAVSATESPAGTWLDLGCGTGNLIVAAEARGIEAVGVDVALRWLVVGRRRDGLERGNRLACGDAAHLPFEDGAFATVTALGVLEHCADLGDLLHQVRRVLQPGGRFVARTVNRYSLLPEPHVGVWGVGFVPRRWADRYVRWRAGLGYAHHYPRSARALAGAVRRAGFRQVRVAAARVLESDRVRLGRWSRAALPVYQRGRTLPVFGRVVRTIAPLLELEATR